MHSLALARTHVCFPRDTKTKTKQTKNARPGVCGRSVGRADDVDNEDDNDIDSAAQVEEHH